jgi:Phosphotransferase enzyme family
MSTTRRAPGELPPRVLRGVEDVVGGPLLAFEPVDGGFSVGGVVGVVTAASGDGLFIKAVPSHHPAANDYRLEARVGPALPAGVPAPALRLFREVDGWVVLGFEPVPGRPAHELWQDDELEATLGALDVSAGLLTPAPAVDVPTVAARMGGRCRTWRSLAGDGRHGPVDRRGLGRWEQEHLDILADLEDQWEQGVDGETLLHFDLRHDNCLVRKDGTVTFVDWGRACTGPPWVDLVCLLLESDLGNRNLEELFVSRGLGRQGHPRDVDGFLVALASYWTHAAALPPIDGAPSLRDRQDHSRRATLRWLAQRWNRY